MFISYLNGGGPEHLDIAKKTADFLLDNTFDGEKFSFIGCEGWFKQGKKRASFDQQPIEACSTVLMLKAAFDITEDPRYLSLQRRAFDWFLGENDLGIPVYNFKTKGCYDGLESGGVNLNQGAESLLSFLLALLCIVESYASSSPNAKAPALQTEINPPTKEEQKKQPAQKPA